MIYKNNDVLGISLMENENGQSLKDSKYCDICGTENPELFYVSIQTDECIGCSDCVNVIPWIDY